MFKRLILVFLILLAVSVNHFAQDEDAITKVLMKTSMGDIELELYPEKAPVSVENFMAYVNEGFYDSLIFHRVINNFMIQGGGYTIDMRKKPTKEPIINEADNGLTNDKGTIAYARTNVINSATAQFFINLKDNDFLNYKNNSPQGYGYAVFGKVVSGMEIVEDIGKVKTTTFRGMGDVPVKQVLILSVEEVIEE